MPDRRLAILALLVLLACLLFMTLGARGSWSFVLWHRGMKLVALLLVGACVAVATVLFQTASGNRILTPSIMGFDSLYMLSQTSLLFGLGAAGYTALAPEVGFAIAFLLLMLAGVTLFAGLLSRAASDLHRLVLAGVILGVLFRSLNSLLARLIAPNEFAIVQGAYFAQFNRVHTELLTAGSVLAALALAGAWAMRHRLDVVALGRDQAISLGVDHRRAVLMALVLVTALVSVSTALVGPVAFFGLLVVAIARLVAAEERHARLLPVSVMVAALTLVGGQTVLERGLGLATTLSVVVEFLGGLTFLFLLFKGRAR